MKLQYRLNPGSGKRFVYTVYAERLLKDDPLYTGTCDTIKMDVLICGDIRGGGEDTLMAVYCDDHTAFVDKVEVCK